MATNVTKTSHFTSGAGNPIKFSEIRAEYGGSANNIKASTYLRNTGSNVDWDATNASSISPRVPDATENIGVTSTNNDWTVDSLRDTISKYVVTQTETNNELSYSASNSEIWNSNLSKNVLKDFNVNGTVKADSTSDDALVFDGNLYNLDINVSGAIYGEGGAKDSDGGDALYVNNTYTKSNVKLNINSNGKIWSGGGGGTDGSDGNVGSNLSCYTLNNYDTKEGCGNDKTLTQKPNEVRSRCRGGSYRRSQTWNEYNRTGYHCGKGSTYKCQEKTNNIVSGGPKGTKGTGGIGKGYSNLNTSIDESPHIGNSGNSGNTNKCNIKGTSSTGNAGNPGNSGGDWGQSSTNTVAGRSIQKKGVKVLGKTSNTVKGSIINI